MFDNSLLSDRQVPGKQCQCIIRFLQADCFLQVSPEPELALPVGFTVSDDNDSDVEDDSKVGI